MAEKPTYEELIQKIKELESSEEFLNTIIENIPMLIFVKEAESLKFIRFNKTADRLKGTDQEIALGKTDYDIFPKKEAEGFVARDRESLNTNTIIDIPEEMIRTGNNVKRIYHTRKIPIIDREGKPLYLLGISEDITERKKLEEQLIQAQKMESIGRLAGGVAHDFNNMLAVIIGNADIALTEMDAATPLYGRLQDIRKAAQRSAELTSQLLAFARRQIAAPQVLDLNEMLAGMIRMLRILIGEDIDLVWIPDAEVCPVKMDPSQIDQILVNLCVNARDAITGVGRIIIETKNVSIDESYFAGNTECLPGDFVMLSVSDNGHGMDSETVQKIFEPFFSTKKTDNKGTGLGLATVYGIVKQNGGFINVYSEPRVGTTFKVYLPREKKNVERIRQATAASSLVKGYETILLVEDEPVILSMATLMLEKFGYSVMAFSRPSKAFAAAQEHRGDIHLLITDVIMPEMNGPLLAEKIRSIHPETKCLFMSGYTDNVIAHRGVLDEGVNFIQKPFSMDAMAEKIRAVLDGRGQISKLDI